jgi:RNA polymerase sigma factor (sigma-70 family)
MLVRRYQRLIYAIPRRAGLGEEQASEVFQRVCLTLVEHLERIEQPDRLGAWLATTARRESWRIIRQSRATVSLTNEEGEIDERSIPADGALLPDEVLERLELQHEVRQAVGQLDERCRALLSLLFYRAAPPPYLEVAAALGVPEGSIGPTRARCLQKLRRLLEAPA